MGFIGDMFGVAQGFLSYAVPFLFVLTVVVFVHEWGHYIVGRLCGVDAKVFSIGFGKELFGFNDRRGTRWRFAAIPLGGYVKFAGDAEATSTTADGAALEKLTPAERSRTLPGATVGRRAAIVAAGPAANFIFAILVFAAVAMVYGRTVIAPRVDQLMPGSAAEQAGMLPGDLILRIEGQAMRTFSDVQRIVSINADKPLAFELERGDREIRLTVTPQLRELRTSIGIQRTGIIGVSAAARPEDMTRETFGPVEAIGFGASESWFVVTRTFDYLGKLVTGRESVDQLSGPIRIAQVSGHAASTSGILGLVTLTAILSVSIGLMNLFPVPMLDGGHLVFYAFEAVRGKPLSERAIEYGFRVGLVLVLLLTVFVTWNDIVQITTHFGAG